MTISLSQTIYIPNAPQLSSESMDLIGEITAKPTTAELFVSSPYPGSEHHLDLSSVPETSKQLAMALQQFHPVTEDYPTQSYVTSFNWQEVVGQLSPEFSG